MRLNKSLIVPFMFHSFAMFAQNDMSTCTAKKDAATTAATALSEVVITGQIEPQSNKKSVFNVRVISAADIKKLAATNLTDVLNQYLNITVRPNGNDGRSTVSMFGLDSQYFKILVDNIPVVSDGGLGNNIDLSQINLNDVEQIEIIEGSMGVTHGANAVSGILNIITKKSSKYKTSVSATVQEETVGDEFSFFDQGRHIQAVKAAHKFGNNWFASVGVNRNDFQGYLDNKKGKDYSQNDGLRGYTWLPKEQLNTTALLSYKKNNFSLFYKFEYFDENVDYYNSTVDSGFNPASGPYRYAEDERYLTHRFYHHLNATGKLFKKLNYNVSASQQKQQRDVESFRYSLNTQTESRNAEVKDQSMEVFYSFGTLSNFFSDKKVDLQLGYEFVNNLGYSLVQEANNTFVPVTKRIENYDFYASAEIKATQRFSVRPGIRYSFQSLFDNQHASSLGLRYLFDKGVEVRGSLGSSFRVPNFQELYSKLIFDGHFFIGNENLIPETSKSYELSFKKLTFYSSGEQLSNMITASFLDVDDRIDMALTGFNPDTGNPEYQYVNIGKYQMWNASTVNQFRKNNLTINLGATIAGVSQKLDNNVITSDDRFLYSINLNSSVSYFVPRWATTLSAYFKHNGRSQQFVASDTEYVISEIEASNWLDASARRNFFKDKLEVIVGARNILDIKNINQTRTSQGGLHGSASQVLMAYGRSYFLKLTYNLNL